MSSTQRDPKTNSHDALVLHPFREATVASRIGSRHESALKLAFSLLRQGDALQFEFSLSARAPADLQTIVLPAVRAAGERKRRDEIWKSTCLELFFAPANAQEYFEINLCPSGDWNVYRFDSYREGMTTVDEISAPLIASESSPHGDWRSWRARIEERAAGSLSSLLRSGAPLIAGAAAVLERSGGAREYWALVHADQKPDFHLRESFRLVL